MTARKCWDEPLISGVNILIEKKMVLGILFIIVYKKEIGMNQESLATVAHSVHVLEVVIF